MAARRTLELSEEQRVELERARDRHPKPHVREKAAALLKVAAGQSPHAVAKQGVLKARDPDTVYRWLNRYLAWRRILPDDARPGQAGAGGESCQVTPARA